MLADDVTRDLVRHFSMQLSDFSSLQARIPFRREVLDFFVNIVSSTKVETKNELINEFDLISIVLNNMR